MKRLIFIMTLLCLTLVSHVCAETINVFSNYQKAEIFINDEFVGQGNARGIIVDPGTHYVRVQLDGVDIFSKIVDVDYGRTETIVVERFIETNTGIANRGAKTIEAKRVRESRGSFGLGVNLGVLSGFSAKWYITDRLGIQGTGFAAFSDDFGYSSWEGRTLFILKETILGQNLSTLYLATGYGEKNKDYRTMDIMFGLDFSLSRFFSRNRTVSTTDPNFFHYIAMGLLSLENSFMYLEVG